MSGLFSSKTTSTVQQNSDPWVGAQPALSTLYSGAVNNYNSGGPQYYPGNTVAPQSWGTQAAANQLINQGVAGTPALNAAMGQAQNTLSGTNFWGNPAFNGYAANSHFDANGMQGMGTLAAIGRGDQLGATAGLQGLENIGNGQFLGQTAGLNGLEQIGNGAFRGTTAGMPTLGQFASGADVGRTNGTSQLNAIANGAMLNSNPYVDSMFNTAANQVSNQFQKTVMPSIASMYEGAGRYGSEAMGQGMSDAQQQYGNALNNLASNIYGQNYANERGLQQSALGQLQNTGLAERAQQLQGAQSMGSLSQNEMAQQLQALAQSGQLSQGEISQMLQGLSNAGQLSSNEQARQLSALGTQTQNQLQGAQIQNQALAGLSNAYQAERNNQMQAMSLAPQLNNAQLMNTQAMLQGGQVQDQYAQNLLNGNIQRWDYNQNLPTQNLATLAQLMNGASAYKQGSSQTQGGQMGSPLNNMLGLGLMGSMIAPSLGGLGAGAAAGLGAATYGGLGATALGAGLSDATAMGLGAGGFGSLLGAAFI